VTLRSKKGDSTKIPHILPATPFGQVISQEFLIKKGTESFQLKVNMKVAWD
jgi:hypothetical protein